MGGIHLNEGHFVQNRIALGDAVVVEFPQIVELLGTRRMGQKVKFSQSGTRAIATHYRFIGGDDAQAPIKIVVLVVEQQGIVSRIHGLFSILGRLEIRTRI